MEALAKRLRRSLPDRVQPRNRSETPTVINDPDPINFWSSFLGALQSDVSIILTDPSWPAAIRGEYLSMVNPLPGLESPRILIPTSGTSGMPKFCIHSADTLQCAASGFKQKFAPHGILHCVNVLPQHHVGGLMPVLRSAECGGSVHFADYKDAHSIQAAPFPLGQASLSLVPTQLMRMLNDAPLRALLKQFGLILIGGAACPLELLGRAREENLRLAPCYGSTETAAMVTVMDPEDFLAEGKGVGSPLPHVQIEIDSENLIRIQSEANLLGYLPAPEEFSRSPFISNDLGQLDSQRHLHILGRADRIIITGGEKVIPEQVESSALLTGLVSAAFCHSVPDPDWGARVELTVVPAKDSPNLEQLLIGTLKQVLPPYAVPKVIHFREEIPINSLGKQIHLGN